MTRSGRGLGHCGAVGFGRWMSSLVASGIRGLEWTLGKTKSWQKDRGREWNLPRKHLYQVHDLDSCLCPHGHWWRNPELKALSPRLVPVSAQWTHPKTNCEPESSVLKVLYTLGCISKHTNTPFYKRPNPTQFPKALEDCEVPFCITVLFKYIYLSWRYELREQLTWDVPKTTVQRSRKVCLSLSFGFQMPLERWPWGSRIF